MNLNVGKEFRKGFFELLEIFGGTVIINPFTDKIEVKGMKNNKEEDPSINMFQFLDKIEIKAGDIIQQKGSNDIWEVYQLEDKIVSDIYVYFIAYVKRVDQAQILKSDLDNKRNKVFVSYSHFDDEYLKEIKRHFKPFLDKIDFWDDTKIKPGQKWKEEIKKAIEHTKVAILLVSSDFLGSDFIKTDELPPLLKAAEEDGAVVLIIILRPCLLEEFPELNQYQALNSPSNSIINMTLGEKEELYVKLVRQTKKIMDS